MILTGHSLGAHLVGYIGRNVPNLGRIDSKSLNRLLLYYKLNRIYNSHKLKQNYDFESICVKNVRNTNTIYNTKSQLIESMSKLF